MNRRSCTLILTPLILIVASRVQAGTIIKLSFGTDSRPDIELVDGVLSTAADAVGASTGDQNTEVSFLGSLSSAPVIEGANASLTLDNIQLVGDPVTVGSTVLQATLGGDFTLYDPSNVLLLGGTLGNGTLSGPIGGTATGGFLTAEYGLFTDGLLLPLLQADNATSSSFSISLSDINNGAGLSLTGDHVLADFTADANANIGARASDVPEPGAALLLLLGVWALRLNGRPARIVRGIVQPDTCGRS
jgi:hypothetical protein